MPKAKEAALRALRIDDSIAEAHLSLAMVKFRFDWDWEGAEREFKRAIELNHGYSAAHYWYSVYLLALARFDEAFTEARLRGNSAPSRQSCISAWDCCSMPRASMRRRSSSFERPWRWTPSFRSPHIVLGLTFGRKGRFDEAIGEFKQALTSAGANLSGQASSGKCTQRAGKTEDAVEILHELRTASETRLRSTRRFCHRVRRLG